MKSYVKASLKGAGPAAHGYEIEYHQNPITKLSFGRRGDTSQ
jgi:hypothetical protein